MNPQELPLACSLQLPFYLVKLPVYQIAFLSAHDLHLAQGAPEIVDAPQGDLPFDLVADETEIVILFLNPAAYFPEYLFEFLRLHRFHDISAWHRADAPP